MLDFYRFLHLIGPLIAQIARSVFRALRAEGFVPRCRPGNNGSGSLDVGFMHCVVFTKLSGLAVGLNVEEESEEGAEPVILISALRQDGKELETYRPVTVKAVHALYKRHTMMPASVCHVVMEQPCPMVHPTFQVRKLRPRIQRTESTALLVRLYVGGRVRK